MHFSLNNFHLVQTLIVCQEDSNFIKYNYIVLESQCYVR